MPLTISDANDSYMEAAAMVNEWQAEFIAEWLQPMVDMGKLQLYQSLDPLVKENLKQMDPQAWAAFEAEIQRIQEGYKNGS